jgi:hypothetical protein
VLKCCGNELIERTLPEKLSLSSKGSVWVESIESSKPLTNFSISHQELKFPIDQAELKKANCDELSSSE